MSQSGTGTRSHWNETVHVTVHKHDVVIDVVPEWGEWVLPQFSVFLMLQVFVGQNLNFSVGTLTYVTDDSGVPVRTIAIAVGASGGGVLILSVFVICIILCVYSSKSREKDKRLTNLLSQMELWELEMADECKRGGYCVVWRVMELRGMTS